MHPRTSLRKFLLCCDRLPQTYPFGGGRSGRVGLEGIIIQNMLWMWRWGIYKLCKVGKRRKFGVRPRLSILYCSHLGKRVLLASLIYNFAFSCLETARIFDVLLIDPTVFIKDVNCLLLSTHCFDLHMFVFIFISWIRTMYKGKIILPYLILGICRQGYYVGNHQAIIF